MAVISITVQDTTGVNINAEINDFNPNFSVGAPPSNSGVFSPGGSQYDEYGIQPNGGTGYNSLLAGGDFTYSTGTLSGQLDTFAFGNNLLNNGVAVPYQTSSFTGGDLSLDTTAFTIANVGLAGSGAGNSLNSTFFDLLRGNEAAFNSWLFNTSGNSISFTGNTGADAITASAYNDVLNGGGGNDTLDGGAGNDSINGGNGVDTVSYASATAGVTVSLGTATAQNTGGAGTDTVINTENLTGSAFADTLSGSNTGANVIHGGAGNDSLSGLGGADTLDGGAGQDVLAGGSGSDDFLFSSGSEANGDTITDFNSGADQIGLDWAYTWDSALNGAGDIFYDAVAGLLKGYDAANTYFEIASVNAITAGDLFTF